MTLASGPTGVPVPAVCLVVLDGWGLAAPGPGNAVSLASTPVFDELWEAYPHTRLRACGRSVGLPEGQMGNSEVGHLNLGAGAVLRQDLLRIDDALTDGSLGQNPVLVEAMSDAPRVHLLGLVSDGGVHSGFAHIRALIELAAELAVDDLVLHCFTDGRDAPPTAGTGYLETVEGWCGQLGAGRVGSVVGRYFAMDRDRRWDRTQRAYDLLVHGRGEHRAPSGPQAVRAAYAREESDEFIAPTTVGEEGAIRPGDSVLAFNFRPDRMRQITRALAEPGFGEGGTAPPGWAGRGGAAPVARYMTLTEYEEGWSYPVAFAPDRPRTSLAATLSADGARQLHVAETEKYPHVTYFFNGGKESVLEGERRELVDSPRDVPTYDHKPEMSAREVTVAFTDAWREDQPRFGIINFANADMVGHTGVIAATVRAVETVDSCLGEVVATVHESGGICVVTADHGNAEEMLNPGGAPHTAHSLNLVPLVVTSPAVQLASDGVLADVAPTILALLGIAQPAGMTGTALARATA